MRRNRIEFLAVLFLVLCIVGATLLLLFGEPALWTNPAPIQRLPRLTEMFILTVEAEPTFATPPFHLRRDLTPTVYYATP